MDEIENRRGPLMIYCLHALSTAIIALFFTQVLHEGVHFFAAKMVGAEVLAFNLFAVKIHLFQDPLYLWKDIFIEASASIVNVGVGFLALIAFHSLKRVPSLFQQFSLQLAGYSMLMGFGYFLFDGLFYTPDSYGDWKSVLHMLDGSILLRLLLIIIGAIGMVFTFFWLARNVLLFVKERDLREERLTISLSLLFIPYIVLGLLFTLFSLWHPLGWPNGFMIVFLQFFFGFSGFLWAFFLSVYWLEPVHIKPWIPLPTEVNLFWLGGAFSLLLFMVFILLPTIYF